MGVASSHRWNRYVSRALFGVLVAHASAVFAQDAAEPEDPPDVTTGAPEVTTEPSDRDPSEGEPRRFVVVMVHAAGLADALRVELDARNVGLVVAPAPTGETAVQRAAAAQRRADEAGAVAAIWTEPAEDGFEVRLVGTTADDVRQSHVPSLNPTATTRVFAVVAGSLLDDVGSPPPALPAAEVEEADVDGPSQDLDDPTPGWEEQTAWYEQEEARRAAESRYWRDLREAPQTITPRRRWAAQILPREAYLRAGAILVSSPRIDDSVWGCCGRDPYDYFGGGVRLAAGKFVHDRLRIEAFGTFHGVVQHGMGGSIGAGLFYAGKARIRFGFGGTAAIAFARNRDWNGDVFGYVGPEFSFPLEVAFETARNEVSISGGLTVTKPGDTYWWPGAVLALEFVWRPGDRPAGDPT